MFEQGWKITALKVAGDQQQRPSQTVAATSLRISFQTDQPLFPYRESDPKHDAAALNADPRLLRIYFIGDGRYEGKLTPQEPWTSRVAWSSSLSAESRSRLLELLNIPNGALPEEWWLTEFEHDWPYQLAPADVYFSLAQDQFVILRPPIYRVLAPWPELLTYLVLFLLLWIAARRLFCRRATGTAS